VELDRRRAAKIPKVDPSALRPLLPPHTQPGPPAERHGSLPRTTHQRSRHGRDRIWDRGLEPLARDPRGLGREPLDTLPGVADDIRNALAAENRRLTSELAQLENRLRAIEASRWFRINPRQIWRRRRPPTSTTGPLMSSSHGLSSSPHSTTGRPEIERFRLEIVERGLFSHDWFITGLTRHGQRWGPIFESLENRGARLLEIGSFEGMSTSYLLWRLPDTSITCVDTFAGSVEHGGPEFDVSELGLVFDRNVALLGPRLVRKLVGDSRRVLLDLLAEQPRFDFVFVDGSHLGLDVIVDASLSWQLLEPGGVLVFDDYNWTELGTDALLRPGPAVDAFLAIVAGKYELLFADHQLAVRKRA